MLFGSEKSVEGKKRILTGGVIMSSSGGESRVGESSPSTYWPTTFMSSSAISSALFSPSAASSASSSTFGLSETSSDPFPYGRWDNLSTLNLNESSAYNGVTSVFSTITTAPTVPSHPELEDAEADLWSLHKPVLAILLLIFCVATVFGNLLVIIAVARERYLHSVTNYFITSLAVADCLVGFVVMPFQAIYEVLDKKWIFGELWCDLWRSLDVLASTASILNLCVISLDRYWAITDPFTYPSRMTNSKACFLIALVWVCSSLISFPAILWWRAVREEPIRDLECTFTEDLGYLVFSSIISFYGPLFVMVFTYYRIYRAAVEQTRSLKLGTKQCMDGDVELTLRIHRGGGANYNNAHHNDPSGRNYHGGSTGHLHHNHHHHQSRRGGGVGATQNSSESCDTDIGHITLLNPHPNDNNGSSSTLPRNNSVRVVPKNLKNFSISRKLAKFAKEKKAAKTLGIVMGVFIVCWLPFFVTNLLSGICKSCLDKAQLVTEVALWGGWINSGMNPVIYACWSRDFRRAFGRIVCACCPGRIRRQYRPGGLRPHLARLTQECPSPFQNCNRDANGSAEYEFPSQKSSGDCDVILAIEKRHEKVPKVPSTSMTMTATVTTAIITPSSPPVGSYSSVSHQDLFNT